MTQTEITLTEGGLGVIREHDSDWVMAAAQACHNARLSTEALEASVVAEMLAACEAVDQIKPDWFSGHVTLDTAAMNIIRSAIAKAKAPWIGDAAAGGNS